MCSMSARARAPSRLRSSRSSQTRASRPRTCRPVHSSSPARTPSPTASTSTSSRPTCSPESKGRSTSSSRTRPTSLRPSWTRSSPRCATGSPGPPGRRRPDGPPGRRGDARPRRLAGPRGSHRAGPAGRGPARERRLRRRARHARSRRSRAHRGGTMDELIAALRAGRPVLFPTDTVYGLARSRPRRPSPRSTRSRAAARSSPRVSLAASLEQLLDAIPELDSARLGSSRALHDRALESGAAISAG